MRHLIFLGLILGLLPGTLRAQSSEEKEYQHYLNAGREVSTQCYTTANSGGKPADLAWDEDYGKWMKGVWGKDGTFSTQDLTIAGPPKPIDSAQALLLLKACAANGDSSAKMTNNFNIKAWQNTAAMARQARVVVTKKMAFGVSELQKRHAARKITCEPVTKKLALELTGFARRNEKDIAALVKACTAKIKAQ
jgi:hypothetical protein